MKRWTTILALAILMAPGVSRAQNVYAWIISGSAVDPFQTEAPFVQGLATLYLWMFCAAGDGVSAAEMDFRPSSAANVTLAFTPANGFLNAGDPSSLLLATACTYGPVVAGSWLLSSNVAGEYCLVPSGNGINGSVDCTNFLVWPNFSQGFSNTGAQASCYDYACEIDAVQDRSWSRVKALYGR